MPSINTQYKPVTAQPKPLTKDQWSKLQKAANGYRHTIVMDSENRKPSILRPGNTARRLDF